MNKFFIINHAKTISPYNHTHTLIFFYYLFINYNTYNKDIITIVIVNERTQQQDHQEGHVLREIYSSTSYLQIFSEGTHCILLPGHSHCFLHSQVSQRGIYCWNIRADCRNYCYFLWGFSLNWCYCSVGIFYCGFELYVRGAFTLLSAEVSRESWAEGEFYTFAGKESWDKKFVLHWMVPFREP